MADNVVLSARSWILGSRCISQTGTCWRAHGGTSSWVVGLSSSHTLRAQYTLALAIPILKRTGCRRVLL